MNAAVRALAAAALSLALAGCTYVTVQTGDVTVECEVGGK